MTNQIKVEGAEEDNPSYFDFIRIKKVNMVYGIKSIAEVFPKELKTIAIEDLIQADASAEMIIGLIKKIKPNMLVLKKDNSFLCIETEIQLGEFIAVRFKKLIASGTYQQMQEAVCIRIKKEWDGKQDNLQPMEIDEDWLKSFCKMHYKTDSVYKIIKL